MSEVNEDLAKLLAICKQEEDEDEEQLTEEELQQALSSPSLHQQINDGVDEDSTECDDYDITGDTINELNDDNSDQSGLKCAEGVGDGTAGQRVKGKVNEYQFQMLDHHIFKGKHGKKLYKCDVCYAVYRHSFSLKRHFIRSHINYGYLCDTDVTNCGINLSASASLQTWKHQISVQPLDNSVIDLPELYCCHSCVLFFDDLPQIKAHVDDCHRNNKSGTIEPIRIPCSQCNMSFIQRHNLMRHIEVVHCGKRLYGCKHCNKKFQTIAERKKHEKSQHLGKQLSSSADQSTPNALTSGQKTTKTHRCLKCTHICGTYAELRKHVLKKHKEFYNSCGFCNKFCFSKKQLSEHLRQKHEKTAKDNSEKLKLKKKLSVREDSGSGFMPTAAAIDGQTLSQQNQFQAYFHCSLCYRRFITYGSLIRHKQIAHRPHVRHCSRLTAVTQMDREVIEPYSNINEYEFYQSLAQKVAENLLFFVDGKYVNPSNDYQVIQNPNQMKAKPISGLNLTKYNFPVDYWPESSPPTPNITEKLEFLLDCNLNSVKNPKFEPLILETGTDPKPTAEAPPKPQYICTVCRQKISAELMAEHEVNNHPNVCCNYIEVETMPTIPSQLLLWQYHSSEGLLHRCPPAPSLTKAQEDSELALNCTKCQKAFPSVSLLHNHILDCALICDSNQLKSSNKCHNNSTQTNASLITDTSITTQASNSLTEANTSVSSPPTESTSEFPSPLSPCKTRSGKRRQLTPEDYVRSKRKRNSQKSPKINNSFDESVVKTEVIDNNNNKNMKALDKEVLNSSQSTATVVSKTQSSVSKSSECLPKRYFCPKCSKRFVYMDSLSKHQLSCKRVFNTKVNKKSAKKVPKKQEFLSNKKLKRNEVKSCEKMDKKTSIVPKNDDNCTTNDDTEEEDIGEELTETGDQIMKSSTGEENPRSDGSKSQQKSGSKDQKSDDCDQSVDSDGDELQEHQCPDCLKVFTYSANFRKHIANVCPIRKQLNDSTTTGAAPNTSASLTSSRESTLPEIIIIKQENPENDELLTEEDLDFEGEGEDDDVIAISPKDELKLDLFRVKQENPLFAFKGSPAQHHSCPYCQRGFTYLANYRKHIKNICPIRQQIDEKKKKVIEDNEELDGEVVRVKTELPPTLVYTPCSLSVRSQIEDTVLTLLRDQTKQDQILQSSEDLIKSKTNPKPEELSQNADNKTKNDCISSSTDLTEPKASANSEEPLKTVDEIKKESSPSAPAKSSFRFRTFSCNICHKIFLSYVTMLKHRLLHKLSDGQLANDSKDSVKAQAANDDEDLNGDKEAANQALAASILKRSKDVIFSKMRINAGNSSTTNTSAAKSATNVNKPVINTTELLEKLARGGITTDSIKSLNTSKSCNSKGQEVITIETNNNISQTFNLQLSASSATSASTSDNLNTSSNNNDSNLEQIIINANNLSDLQLDVLKDGVIVAQDLHQLIDSTGGEEEEDVSKCPEVLLNLDDIENANEVWITITDTDAFVQVPNQTPVPVANTSSSTGSSQ